MDVTRGFEKSIARPDSNSNALFRAVYEQSSVMESASRLQENIRSGQQVDRLFGKVDLFDSRQGDTVVAGKTLRNDGSGNLTNEGDAKHQRLNS
ncbi:MAG: hypothetical protein KC777_25505 [Cyanobacteria bacterium HKST-UBA02]|nr:hypothetical protein [Cyanobacteria bacterium HKST-UBA02]